MHDSTEDDDDDLDYCDAEVFDTASMKMQAWPSKDKLTHTIRLSDDKPINEMKIYLFLREKLRLMEVMFGIEGDDEPHSLQ